MGVEGLGSTNGTNLKCTQNFSQKSDHFVDLAIDRKTLNMTKNKMIHICRLDSTEDKDMVKNHNKWGISYIVEHFRVKKNALRKW